MGGTVEGQKLFPHKMVNILKKLKNLSILLFYLGLIYRWGKGLKPKMIKNSMFFYTICEKIKKNFIFTFFDFFDFFDFLEQKYGFLEVIEHVINIFVTK